MINQTLSHYRIIEQLGQGGMGVVYRAEDIHLDRQVAVKVLPDIFADDPERLARFKGEAKALAKLSHPNILPIYEFGEEQGVTYAVTELLEGETLRERLEHGAVPWRSAVEIAAAVADGLAAAHGTGIVHRDIKPENVFITTDGQVKVLDFGLAKVQQGLVSGLDTLTLPLPETQPGTVLGTIGYMAPEQVRGGPADARSDIFALGCVFHEMLTGRSPFKRDTAADTLSAVLNEQPPNISISGVEVTPELDRLVRRCLEKRAYRRFQSASDLAFALRSAVRAGPVPAGRQGTEEKSIVVLPFDNLSPDPENEFFADGLTEEIITDLSGIRSLQVTSKTSAWKFKGARENLRTIASELGVRYVLEGSVRRAGDQLRITTQLIDSDRDVNLWAQKYSGTVENVFDIQESVSRSIVGELELRLTPEEDRKIAERPIQNLRAYDLYLRAHQEIYAGRYFAALQLARRALEIVGDNSLLYYTIGHTLMMQMLFGERLDPSHLEEVERCADKVTALDPGSPHDFALRAMIHYKKGERVRAARLFNRSLAKDPNDFWSLIWLTSLYFRAGKAALQRPLIERLLKIDPLSYVNYTWLGWIEFWETGSTASLLDSFRKMVEMDPDHPYGIWWYAYSLAQAGHEDQSFELLDLLFRKFPNVGWGRLVPLFGAALRGDSHRAIAAVGAELQEWAEWDDFASWVMADCYSLVGEQDNALRWMENATRLGFINVPMLSRDRFLDGLREEERFRSLLERVTREWASFEVLR